MNINYENQDQQTLLGTYRTQSNPTHPIQMHDIKHTHTPPDGPRQIVHKVVYGDTLEGIALTYDVSISKLKQRNKLESDSIYYLKQLVIPDPRIQPNTTQSQAEYLKIEEFVMHMETSQKSSKTARYYLSQSNWDVEKAVHEYRKDLQWQRKNKITHIPLAEYNPLFSLQKKNQ